MDEIDEQIAEYCKLISRGANTLGEWQGIVNYTDSQKQVPLTSLRVMVDLMSVLHKLEAPFKEQYQDKINAELN